MKVMGQMNASPTGPLANRRQPFHGKAKFTVQKNAK